MLSRTRLFCRASQVLLDTESHRLSPKATIATVTLSDPASRNALTEAMGDEFAATMAALRSDAKYRDVRAVVLTGAGSAFSAGGDMKFLRARLSDTPEGNIAQMRAFYKRFLSVRTLEVPVVAALNGHAIGAGFCVALATDVRVVADTAKFAVNFCRLGIHPGMGTTYFLPRLAGVDVASRLILTGEQISGSEAKELGLASFAVPAAEVLPKALEIAKSIATASEIAVRTSVKTLRAEDASALDRALQNEAEQQAICYAQRNDLDAALTAMAEKRQVSFI